MIVIGTLELKFTRQTGSFCCPHCEQERTYRRRNRRLFLTLYFIPLIPLQSLGEILECTTCRKVFDVALASFTVEQLKAQKRRAACELIRRALIVIVAADNVVTDEELEAVRDFARRQDQPEISREQLQLEAASIQQASWQPLDYLRYASQQLDESDRELLVYHAFVAATASGELSAQRQTLLAQLPDAVGIPEATFREIVLRAVHHR